MSEEEEVMHVVHGRVKWFDPSKGFGFIVSDQTDADILLHANVLRNFGQGSVADGAGIEVRIQRTQRGVQADTERPSPAMGGLSGKQIRTSKPCWRCQTTLPSSAASRCCMPVRP